MIPMPKPMQDAISKAGKLPEGHPLRDFIIAVAELAVCPMAQMQWGHLWRDRSFPLVLFNTANHNSYSWLHTMFANNELAQEICRPYPIKGENRNPPPFFARARLAQLHSKTHATEQDACDGQGRAQDACLDAVAATKAEENPHTKGRQLTN